MTLRHSSGLIQHAAGLLGVHQVQVDGARRFDCRLYGLVGDFVELDAAGVLFIDAQHIGQMPGDGLALAIRVSGQIDLGGRAGVFADAGQDFAAPANGDVFGLKAVFDIHAQLRLGQIAHMALRRLDLVTAT